MGQPDTTRTPDAVPGRRLRKRRRWWLAALAVAALPVAALLVLALVEIRIPVEFAHQRVELAAREASGLETRIEGRLFLVTGMRPGIEISDLVIEAGTQAAKLELLRLGVGRAEIELRALLDREVRVRRVLASDLTLRLDAAALQAIAAAESQAGMREPERAPGGWRFASLRNLQVERARWTLGLPALVRSVEIGVDALTLHAAEAEPLTVEARGTFAGEAMKVAFHTASFDQLRSGAQAIPIDLRIALEDASFSVKGTLDLEAQRGEYAIAATAHGSFLERVVPGHQAVAGEVNEVSIEGRVRNEPGTTSIELATLAAGRTRGRAEIQLSDSGNRKAVRGRLDFEALDLTPWLQVLREQHAKAPAQGDALDAIRRVQQAADVDFDIKVATLMWPERTANDLQLALRAGKDAAALDGSARLHEGKLRAQARLDTAQQEARLLLEAQAGPVPLERLHAAIEREGVSGVVHAAKLSARSRGASLAALADSLEGELVLSKVEAKWRPGKEREALRVAIDSARLAATRDALHASLAAVFADASIALKLAGKRTATIAEQRVVRSDFDLGIRRTRRPGMQFAARGSLALDRRAWSVELQDARLGASRGSATLKGAWGGAAPIALRAALERLDLKALDFFAIDGAAQSEKPAPAGDRWEDIRVLPAETRLPDMDFELAVKRLDAAPARFQDLRASGRSRDGQLAEANFEVHANAGALSGKLNADLRGKVPQLQASVKAKDFDAAGILARVGVKASRANTGTLDASIDLRGAILGDAIAGSTLKVSAQGLDVALPGLLDARHTLRLNGRAELSSVQGRLQATASGTLDAYAFDASSSGAELAALLAGSGRLPLEVALKAANSQLELRGTVAKGPEAHLDLQLKAQRADQLLALAGLRTDVRGALTAQAHLKLTPPARYEFADVDVRLGESAFGGRVLADWSAKRPRIEATLAGPILYLRDLGIGSGQPEPAAGRAKPAARGAAGGADADWLRALRTYDAVAELKIDQFHGEGDLLGNLHAALRLADGRLSVAPFEIRKAGSALRGAGEMNAAPSAPDYALHLELAGYDLTPLLRALQPGAPGTATLDARLALRGRGLDKAAIANLQGEFDVAGYGHDLGSGAIGAMGLNIFRMALRTLDRDEGSRINCAVGVFDIDQGLMKSRALFVDTTRLRIMGNLDLELASGALAGALRPHPKNPSLFSINTPVNIGGTITAPHVAIATGALPGLLIRYSNPYTIFLGALMDTSSAQPDGSADCRAAYGKAGEARTEQGERRPGLLKLLP
jgi:hypothetical protein